MPKNESLANYFTALSDRVDHAAGDPLLPEVRAKVKGFSSYLIEWIMLQTLASS